MCIDSDTRDDNVDGVNARPPRGRVHAAQSGEVPQQLFGRQVVVEERLLGQESEPCAGAQIAGRLPQDLGTARRRLQQMQQQLQRGGLAGAVRAEQAEDPAARHVKGEIVERAPWPRAPEPGGEIFRETFSPDDWIHHTRVQRLGYFPAFSDLLISY